MAEKLGTLIIPMTRYRVWIIIVILLLIGVGLYLYSHNNTEPKAELNIAEQEQTTSSPAPVQPVVENPAVFYPMTNYQSRITNRDHGKETTLADSEGFSCGGQFEGIHVGDDLEVTATELTAEMPFFAISDGKVLQASLVGGYGGLLVTENTISEETVNAYYGHIKLDSLKFTVGQSFKAGDFLGYLGEDCSAATSEERKHLHFAIRKGSSIDVRGYLESSNELIEWHSPAELLKAAVASEPKL